MKSSLLFLFPVFLFCFVGCQSSPASSSSVPSSVSSASSSAPAPDSVISNTVDPLTPVSTHLPVVFVGSAMTIPFRISIGDPFNQNERLQIEAVITSAFDEVDKIYNKWNPQSELSRMNALEANLPFSLSPQMHQFLQRIDPLVELSQGKFDPTIEPLQRLWKANLEKAGCPDLAEIADLKGCLGWKTIAFTDGIYIKKDGRTQLDFGGVAKGFCVDLLIERMNNLGFKNLYVEWGGEIRTIGQHPEKRPWHVCVAEPAKDGTMRPIAYLDLINSAIAASGDAYQYWTVKTREGEEKTYCHVFDPFTLSPLEVKSGSVATAALLGPDCFTADALAKVLMVFPSLDEGKDWVDQLKVYYPCMQCWIKQRE